jgi:hypothetical protein
MNLAANLLERDEANVLEDLSGCEAVCLAHARLGEDHKEHGLAVD